MLKYRTILIDPPWNMRKAGRYQGGGRNEQPRVLPYKAMCLEAIESLPILEFAEVGCHIWLWATDQFLIKAGILMEKWGFIYHGPIVWAKPSGYGNFFLHRTEFLLFGYHKRCQFNGARYIPNYYELDFLPDELEPADYRYTWPRVKAGQHSKKPEGSYELIESVSDSPRLEIFARPPLPLFPAREGWTQVGDGMDGRDINQALDELRDKKEMVA